LQHIEITNIDFWDETHKKVRIGRYKTVKGGKQIEYRFPRSVAGKLDLEHGEFRERGTEYNMKYEKEARFCTGCAIGMDSDGNPLKDDSGEYVGVLLPLFDYSKTTIVTHKDYDNAFWGVVKAAKNASETSEFVESNREEGKLYETDPLIKIRHVNRNGNSDITIPKKLRDVLEGKQYNVKTVGDLRDYFQLQPPRWKHFLKYNKGMSEERFIGAINDAKDSLPGEPTLIDHRLRTNPYIAKYGPSQWKQKVEDTPVMKKLTDVRTLIDHIVKAGNERRQGTKYADDWYFYHDALSLMTANETIEWMRKKDILKHWILPEHDLNSHLSYYKNPRPIGCNPGAMPWDASLNKDHDDIVLRHVAATSLLDKDDPRKFSLATPDECARAYRRIYEANGIPSKRIVQDIMKTTAYWQQVFDNDGLNINKNINGQRGDEGRALGVAKRGGARVKTAKQDLKSFWYHDDAVSAMAEFLQVSQTKFEDALSKVRQQHKNISVMDDAVFEPEDFELMEATATCDLDEVEPTED